jgi:regulator of cell morphogenesis and NO signaling
MDGKKFIFANPEIKYIMYQTKKTYIRPDQIMAELIFENPALLLMMEHFELDFIVQDKTVAQICSENNINQMVFITFGNLYNGFVPSKYESFSVDDISIIIRFLKNSHNYYKQDKYPEIKEYINQLFAENESVEIKLIEKFFNEYFEEVSEHLEYEEKVAFPFFCTLIDVKTTGRTTTFSAKDYLDHHTDIETKLADLKNLLLKHISLKDDRKLRRRLLLSLFELEFDLKIHSVIEEMILIPLIEKIETAGSNA